MKTFFRLSALLSLCALGPLAQAQLAASNVRPAQRAGSKLVDIDYDVTGTTSPVDVAQQISADGGSTCTAPATTLSGAIGTGVTPGSNLRVTWNAGADRNQQRSSQTKARLTVTEVAGVPTGFALIPSGSFTMGDALDGDSDAPTHTVTLSAFYMAKNLVTKVEWDTVRTWGTSNGYSDLAAGAGKASNHPVQTISWWDAIKYCNARSQKEGLTPVYMVNSAVMKTGTTAPTVNWTANGYRLPTEAEWEKAARGGLSGKRFSWGDTISQSQANYSAYSGYSYDLSGAANHYHPAYATESAPYTSPVGSFAANGYGLNDMAGNVWQWCWDWYGAYDTASPTDPRGGVLARSGWTGAAAGAATPITAASRTAAATTRPAPTAASGSVLLAVQSPSTASRSGANGTKWPRGGDRRQCSEGSGADFGKALACLAPPARVETAPRSAFHPEFHRGER